MKNRNFLHKPSLEGEKIIIRPFEDQDCERMFEIINEPLIKKLTGSVSTEEEAHAPASPEEREEIINWYKSRNEQDNRLDLAVVCKDSNQVVGEVVFNAYDAETGNVNFRTLICESSCNKGLGTEAVQLFIQYGMEALKLHKIELTVNSFNPRAERVYLKTGFKLEGVKRESFLYDDEYIDVKLYAILDKEYVNIKLNGSSK